MRVGRRRNNSGQLDSGQLVDEERVDMYIKGLFQLRCPPFSSPRTVMYNG